MNLPKGKIQITSNGFLSYEIFEANSDSIYEIGSLLENHFKFKEQCTPALGLDSIFWDFYKEEIKLTVGWDIWSGCFVMSHCEKGNELITQFASYMESL